MACLAVLAGLHGTILDRLNLGTSAGTILLMYTGRPSRSYVSVCILTVHQSCTTPSASAFFVWQSSLPLHPPKKHATHWKTQLTQDVNGDGFDDVMVGAWGASSAAGEILVVFGAATFSAVVVAADLDGSQGFLVRGATTSDAAGFDLAAAGVSSF